MKQEIVKNFHIYFINEDEVVYQYTHLILLCLRDENVLYFNNLQLI